MDCFTDGPLYNASTVLRSCLEHRSFSNGGCPRDRPVLYDVFVLPSSLPICTITLPPHPSFFGATTVIHSHFYHFCTRCFHWSSISSGCHTMYSCRLNRTPTSRVTKMRVLFPRDASNPPVVCDGRQKGYESHAVRGLLHVGRRAWT